MPGIPQLDEFLARLRAEQPPAVAELLGAPVEPPEHAFERRVRACPPPAYTVGRLSVDEARRLIRRKIDEYLAMPNPAHILLVRAAAGVGKTTAGVETAERIAGQGWRVAYIAPRHDFWADVQAIASQPGWWYEWQPRQEGADDRPHTCDYPQEINSWINRGYEAMDFCSGVCGWQHVNERCAWHKQKTRPEPIIFVQHAHAAGGHPLEFRLAIGDENPLQAFSWQWNIPAGKVLPRGMPDDEPLKELLLKLSGLCAGAEIVQGPDLLEQLGGAQWVAEVCRMFVLPAEVIADVHIHSVTDAERAGYFHLPRLVPLLLREAEAHLAGRQYPHRIVAGKSDLSLLLRRPVDRRLPAHIIWLDATGNEHVYHEIFGRPVEVVDAQPALRGRVHVITDRANGKGTFKVEQAARQVAAIIERRGYRRPAVVTFQQAEATIAGDDWLTAHFYGARGTNRLEDCDALFVVGTPMPAQPVLERLAAQLYFSRDRAFATAWTARYVAYNHLAADGQGREYPAGGYWSDPDLQALVWQMREAEIIQAVHRARPVHRDVDIWLLSNLPIPELPVHRLTTWAELVGAPDEALVSTWDRVEVFVAGRDRVTLKDLQALPGVKKWETANKYLKLLVETGQWELCEVEQVRGRRGQLSKAIRRLPSDHTNKNLY